VLRLPYLALTGVFALLRLLPTSSTDKDVEIVVLRYQLASCNAKSTSHASPHPTGLSLQPYYTGCPDQHCGNFT
jgi:hypothetical protein